MNSCPQATYASKFAAKAVNSAARLFAALGVIAGALSSARAGTPVSGVTNFNSVPTQNVLANSSAGTPGATAANISGWDFNVISPSSALVNVDVRDGSVGSNNGVAISRNDYSTADFSVSKVSANDHSTFDLKSVGLNVQLVQGSTVVTGHSVILTGLNAAGNPIAGATLTSTANSAALVNFDVSANTSFTGISTFSVQPVTAGDSIGYIFVDNINAINFGSVDNVPPDAPSTPHLAVGSDSGASSSDNLTNVNSPTLIGTAEAGSTVKLYDTDGTTVLGSGPATGENWSIASSYLSQGNHTITARAIDAAGNVSNASAGLTVTIDSVSPGVSSVAVPANGSYGEGDNLDFTVNYSKAITVTTSGGTPYIAVALDTGGAVRASFLYGSGTSALTFRYTVVNGNFDSNGVSVSSSITLNGGTLRDTAGNNALLTLTGIGSTSGVRVDATPPTVSSINRIQTSPTNLASLSYTVTFSKPVTGVDVSDFTLTTTGTVSALNLNVAPVTSSTYTVTISSIAGAGTLRLDLRSSGTGIADAAGNGITGGYTAGQPYTVDRVAPVVSSVGVPTNATYLAAQNLAFSVTFSETVTVVTTGGVPRLPITLDTGGTVFATYLSGSGSSTLTFRYTVVAGNADPDGVTVATALQANGGTIRDSVGNDATLPLSNVAPTAGVLVDAILPAVNSVTLPSNATYTAGQSLDFIVNYSKAVTVNTAGGTPYLGLLLDTGGTVRATYLSGSGSTALTFRYTIVTGNADTNGIALASSFTSNSGTLRDVSGNNATLTLSGVGVTTGILVDAVAPTVTSINRQTPTAASTNGSTVVCRVTFSESVVGVDTADFALTTTNGVTANINSINAVSGSIYDVTISSIAGTGTLRLDLNSSGTGISDLAGNAIAAGAIGTQFYTIDTVPPTVASVAVPASGTYKAGDNLDFTVTFSENVSVTGVPRVPVTLDTGGLVNANYVSGTGTTKLLFRYVVGVGTMDTTGVSLGSSLDLNGGSLLDSAGNSAILALNNVGDTTAVLVDGVAPAVLGVSVPASGTYKLGSALDFIVSFSEPISVTGVPRIGLTLDTGGTVFATYLSGSGTSSLVFRYTVAAGNADKTGIVLGSAIAANGGTLRDAAGNAAVLSLTNVGATDAVLVDGIVPTVTSIVRVGSATTNATSLDYIVTFSESVTGVSTASFTATTTGTVGATIGNLSATNTTTYKVTLNPVSGDGSLRLDLAATGTGIADLAGNAIASGFTTGDVDTIDHTAPAVVNVGVPANASYVTGQNLDFILRLSEGVTLNITGGIPYLPVTLDTGTVRAAYVSGSGSNALLFRYTVVTGKIDTNGIVIGANLVTNGAVLRDIAGNDLNPALNGVPPTSGILIDAIAPTVLSVTAPADGTYIKGAVLTFTVSYSETVNVVTTNGSPSLAIALATGGPAQAAYVSGSGSSTLTFRYSVAAGQQDADGIAVSPSISLNGATIRDVAGNDATLSTPTFNTAAVLIDGLVPAIVSIARFAPTNATTSRDSVKYRVTFNKDVTGVIADDFLLSKTGTAAGSLNAVTAVSGKVYDVTIGSVAFGGTIRLDLVANSGIADVAGNVLNSAFTTGDIYTLVSNHPPSFTAGSDVTIGQDAGPQTVIQWATNINAGAPSESSQVLTFNVTTDQPGLFFVAPAISSDGTLTFTPSPTASGTANVTVILQDDIDANNTSEPATFAITSTSYNGQLGTYNGIVQAAPDTAIGNDKTGVLRVVVGKKGAFTGSLRLSTSTFALRGSFNTSGVASFGNPASTSFALRRANFPTLSLTMLLDVTGGTDTLTATLTEDGLDFAQITADRALYVATKNPATPFLNVPSNLLGRYTVVFAAKAPENQNRSSDEYPQGDGAGILFVSRSGVTSFTGTLADGTVISCSNSLSKTNVWPFYAPILNGKGSVSAAVFFRDTENVSDLDALDLHWYHPGVATAKRYAAGWPEGIRVDLIGSKFAIPSSAANTSIFTGVPTPGTDGNAMANFTDGNIPNPGLSVAINVSAKNVVTAIDHSEARLNMVMLFPSDQLDGTTHLPGLVPNGVFRGNFIHPLNNARARFRGVVFQKQKSAFGFFTGPTECGAVTLTPQPR